MPLVELPGFEERVRRNTWSGSTAVEVYAGRRSCSRCSVGDIVELDAGIQPALFYDAGYGAAERRTVAVCLACGRTSVVRLDTLNPRRLPASDKTLV